MTDRERIYNLVDKVCDLSIKAIDKITELKQENSELKKRVAKLENASKPKRKFRAMTKGEWCDPKKCPECEYHYAICYCDYSEFNGIPKGLGNIKPYKKRNGKYILIEVKE